MKRALCTFLAAAMVTAQGQSLSFVACPIVRDTKTTPCWLAEYNGETYFLGVQSGVAQDFYPPQLNHDVLVEGTVAAGPRVCGGIPLQPVKTSVILEINRSCNTILPVEDGIEPPRRGSGRGALNASFNSWTRSEGPSDSTIFFDFDNDFLSLHSTGAVQRIVENFQPTKAKELQLTAYRGSSKLSNGTVMVEKSSITAERIAKLSGILLGLGVPSAAIKVQSVNDERPPDGVNDPWSRKVMLSVKP